MGSKSWQATSLPPWEQPALRNPTCQGYQVTAATLSLSVPPGQRLRELVQETPPCFLLPLSWQKPWSLQDGKHN